MINSKSYITYLKSKKLEALDYIIDKYSNLMFKVAYSVLNNRELSNECINDAYLKIWSCASDFEGNEDNFRNWICTITKYRAIDMLRKEEKHKENFNIDDLEQKVFISSDKNEDVMIVKDVINSMDDTDREIFVRRFFYEEKISDIARVMNMSENAINLRILRGKKRVCKVFEEEVKDEKR